MSTIMGDRIADLQAADLPRMRWNDIFSEGKDGLTTAQAITLDDYFFHFMVTPKDDDGKEVCPCCRERMQGGVEGTILQMGGLGVSLEWGIVHGEAFCSGCGWPYRVYHHDIGGKGEDALIKKLVASLPYHPSEMKLEVDDDQG